MPLKFLPIAIYENRYEPQVGDVCYVVPDSDSVVAEPMEVSTVSGRSFTCEGYTFMSTGCVGHVGKGANANAYDSLASYFAIGILPKSGWTQHDRRDVFFRQYVNKRITPPLRRTAYLQMDIKNGKFCIFGQFLGEGQNLLGDLSVEPYDTSSAFKIRDYLAQADGIILGSYAMNVTKEMVLNMARNLNRGAE